MTVNTRITDHRLRKFELSLGKGYSTQSITIEVEEHRALLLTSLRPIELSRESVDDFILILEHVAKYMDGQDG